MAPCDIVVQMESVVKVTEWYGGCSRKNSLGMSPQTGESADLRCGSEVAQGRVYGGLSKVQNLFTVGHVGLCLITAA